MNRKDNFKRTLSSRFINQYDSIGFNLWEISKDLNKILKNQDKKLRDVAYTLEEAANLIAWVIINFEKNKKLCFLLDKSKSKSAENILYKIEFLEKELEAYIKVFDK